MPYHLHPKMLLAVMLILMGTFLYQPAQAQEWLNFTNSSQIYDIAQDGEFLWIGTNGGLVQFNRLTNEKVAHYLHVDSGLPANKVRSVAVDQNGVVWVGTYTDGLAAFDGTTWSHYTYDNSPIPYHNIWDLAVDSSNRLWIGTGNGLAVLDDGEWTIYDVFNSELPGNGVGALLVEPTDSGDVIWIGTWDGGVASWHEGEWTIYNADNSGLPYNYVLSAALDSDGNKWFGTGGAGLARFDGSDWTVFDATNSAMEYNWVWALAVDAMTQRVWAGLGENDFGSLVEIENSTMEIYDRNNSLLDFDHINTLFQDSDGVLWMGSLGQFSCSNITGNGLVRVDGDNWHIFDISNSGLSDDRVYSLDIDPDGRVWAGTYYGFAIFDGSGWQEYNTHSEAGLPHNVVHDVAFDASQTAWLATYDLCWGDGGLVAFDGTDFVDYNPDNSPVPAQYMQSLLFEDDGTLWVGTGNGLAIKSGAEWEIYDPATYDLPFYNVDDIVEDQNGDKWLATGGGLIHFDGENWTLFDPSNSALPAYQVRALAVDGQNHLWIGTEFGLARLSAGDWTNYSAAVDGLPSDVILTLACDSAGQVWVGTQNGLATYNGQTWQSWNHDNSDLNASTIFSLTIDAANNKWIGTYGGGLYVFNEEGVLAVEETQPNPAGISDFRLMQNYPNPFRARSAISYRLASPKSVRLAVYNMAGQVVKTLANGQHAAGLHTAIWNGRNDDGQRVSSGVYFYRLETEGTLEQQKRMVLLR